MADPLITGKKITEAEYFELDEGSEEPLTFYDGEVFAMVGARLEHNQICTNIGGHFNDRLPDSCFVVGATMRVQVEPGKQYTYPDVALVCGETDFLDPSKRDTLRNPILIAEVPSPSTQSFDRGDKFAGYRKIPTLSHYLLVSQFQVQVEHFFKNDRGHWELEEKDRLGDALHFPDLNCDLPLRAIYRRIHFPG